MIDTEPRCICTLGAQVICIPGTGKVVTYIVMQRYMYRVPIRKKNLLATMALYKKREKKHRV